MYYNRKSRRAYNQEPRTINARFKSTCPETGKTILPGDSCLYYPSEKKAYHKDSKTAVQHREMLMDEQILNPGSWSGYLSR